MKNTYSIIKNIVGDLMNEYKVVLIVCFSFLLSFFMLEQTREDIVYLHSEEDSHLGGEMNAVLVPFQWVSKRLLNEDKASGGCHGFSKEGIVQAQFKIRTQLCQGEINKKLDLETILQNTPKSNLEHAFKMIQREAERIRQENHQRQLEQNQIMREQEIRKERPKLNNNSLQEHKWLKFHATYYGRDCRGCSGITATGINVQRTIYFKELRIVAVDPAIIPLGTIVEIKTPNENFKAIAADKGGAIKGHRLDILVESEEISVQYGRHDVQLRIIN